MKTVFMRLGILLLAAMFLFTAISCDQPKVSTIPDSGQEEKPSEDHPVPPEEKPDGPTDPSDPGETPSVPPRPDRPEISEIRTVQELMLYAEGYIAYDEDATVQPLDDSVKELVYSVVRNVLIVDPDELIPDDSAIISVVELGGENSSGSYSVYNDGQSSLYIHNGTMEINGRTISLENYVIDYMKGEHVGGTAWLDGVEAEHSNIAPLMSEAIEKDSSQTELLTGRDGNRAWSAIWMLDIKDGDYVRKDKVCYSEKLDEKTVYVGLSPYYVYPYDRRSIEYIAIDNVSYDTTGVAEFIFGDIQELGIYDYKLDTWYESGNDAVLGMTEGDTLEFFPYAIPDTDAVYEGGFTWSITDSNGNPTDVATISVNDKGIVTVTAVSSGDVILKVTSDAKPELTCSLNIQLRALPRINIERPVVSLTLPTMAEFVVGIEEPIMPDGMTADADPGTKMSILSCLLDWVNPGAGTMHQETVWKLDESSGHAGELLYVCDMTKGGTYDVYDMELNGWMTIGEDEYIFKDCTLRLEGTIPVSESGTCIKNGLEVSVYDTYEKFRGLMYAEDGTPLYDGYGTYYGKYSYDTINNGDVFVIWTGLGKGSFTSYYKQDTSDSYPYFKFKSTGTFDYDSENNVSALKDFSVSYAMTEAQGETPKTWYDPTIFETDDEIPNIVFHNLGHNLVPSV